MRDKIGTHHADLRLLQRTREFNDSLTELWQEGIACEVKYQTYDEARVVPSENVVLLMEDERLITVLDNTHNVTIDGENFQDYLGDALDGT
jgi:hypothetical protein